MKSLFYGIVLAFCICAHLRAEKLTATICDETNSPIEGVNVSLRSSRGNKIVATTLTAHNGSFVLHDVQAGKYTLLCTHVGYSDYSANVQIVKDQDLALGTLIMFTESVEINEVVVSASRNVFTTDKQLIYPSDQQAEASSGGLDLLQKLPIQDCSVTLSSVSIGIFFRSLLFLLIQRYEKYSYLPNIQTFIFQQSSRIIKQDYCDGTQFLSRTHVDN